jgi:hypothetical protein
MTERAAMAAAGSTGTAIRATTAAPAMAAEVTAAAAEAMAAEAMGAAIEGVAFSPTSFALDQCTSLDSFQCEVSISLELLQNSVFAFASRGFLQYRRRCILHHQWTHRFNDHLFLQRA